ncbi:hypothetical protein ACGFJC_35225 [Nonomuraea fuscirosea]|uniref:RNA polymerase sigma factor n=1 Tax=Nonomuraea fuscirosea TaxID=1291556 RepID=UPI003723E46D
MSQPLTDQRQRAELIAELYDLYAAGLFAYCADQLGDLGSASDVLVTVLTSVPATVPPRAAIYAFARREIHRRDITYSPPAVDPLIDPATALVERSLRELRPHHREVLVLCAVCGLSKSELAWVLNVAPDTAEELAVGAGHRFRRALGAALASAGARLPKPVADVFGALKVAPLNDVLGRLPWPQPPGAVRIHFAGSRTAAPGPMFVKPRWPSPPVWPQPLAEADPATSTVIFPQELLTPPGSAQVSPLEETTTPMPKLGRRTPPSDMTLRDPLGSTRPFRDVLDSPGMFGDALSGNRLPAPGPGAAEPERPFFMAPPEASAADPFVTGDVILPKDAPDPYMTGDVLVHRGPERVAPQPEEFRQPPTPLFQRTSPPDEAAPLFQPRAKPATGATAEPALRPFAGPATGSDARPFAGPATGPDVRPSAGRAGWPADVLDDGPAQGFLRGPAAKPATRSAAAPADGSAARSAGAPALRPVAKPVAKPATRPAAKPAGKPAGKPGAKPAEEPVYRLPGRRDEPRPEQPRRETPKRPESLLAPRPVRARPVPKRRPDNGRPPKMVRRKKDHHYDWIWEAVGFLLCVAIAMIVFFSMPIFTGP